MKLEDIHQLWDVDAEIDEHALHQESLKIPKLHAKYSKIYTNEAIRLHKMKNDLQALKSLKYDYYSGDLNGTEELKERGWEPWRKNNLKSDIPRLLDSDKEIISMLNSIGIQSEKVNLLESIIKSIQNRGYTITTAVNYQKFLQGFG